MYETFVADFSIVKFPYKNTIGPAFIVRFYFQERLE